MIWLLLLNAEFKDKIIKDITRYIPEDSKVVVLNFHSISNGETFLGSYLARLLTSSLSRKAKKFCVIDRTLMKRTIKEELKYSVTTRSAFDILKSLEANVAITGDYILVKDSVKFISGLSIVSIEGGKLKLIHTTKPFTLRIEPYLAEWDVPIPDEKFFNDVEKQSPTVSLRTLYGISKSLNSLGFEDARSKLNIISSKIDEIWSNITIDFSDTLHHVYTSFKDMDLPLLILKYKDKPMNGMGVRILFNPKDFEGDTLVITDMEGNARIYLKPIRNGELCVKFIPCIKLDTFFMYGNSFTFTFNIIKPRNRVVIGVGIKGDADFSQEFVDFLETLGFIAQPLGRGNYDITITGKIRTSCSQGLGGIYEGYGQGILNIKGSVKRRIFERSGDRGINCQTLRAGIRSSLKKRLKQKLKDILCSFYKE